MIPEPVKTWRIEAYSGFPMCCHQWSVSGASRKFPLESGGAALPGRFLRCVWAVFPVSRKRKRGFLHLAREHGRAVARHPLGVPPSGGPDRLCPVVNGCRGRWPSARAGPSVAAPSKQGGFGDLVSDRLRTPAPPFGQVLKGSHSECYPCCGTVRPSAFQAGMGAPIGLVDCGASRHDSPTGTPAAQPG